MKYIKGDLLRPSREAHFNRDKMIKMSFKPYMTIIYASHNHGDVECMLMGCDFDEEIFYLSLPDGSAYNSQWPDGTFPARIENCKLPTKKGKMKL